MRLSILVISFLLVTSTLQGKIAFYSARDGNSEIYVMSSTGIGQTRLTDNEGSDLTPVWSPNGQQIAFGRTTFNRKGDTNYEVYVMDADGGNQRNLTHHPAFDGSPDWSPDGTHIAFSSGRDGDLNIYVMDADGDNMRQITRTEFATAPKWSPDGSQIAFEAMLGLGDGRQVYVMNADDGTKRWQVSEPIPDAVMFVEGWSPDGTQILYKASIHALVTDSTVFIATLNAAKSRTVKHAQVPLPKMDSSTAAWGADGKSILISLRRVGEKWDIYRFRLLDGQLIQLTNHPASDTSPNEWNPLLPVSPQGLTPKRWGEIKSNSYPHRGNGRGSIPPIP